MDDRSLDALVAEKVLGWTLTKDRRRGSPLLGSGGTLRGAPVADLPAYSTTGDGMLAVIEAMREKWWVVALSHTDFSGKRVQAFFKRHDLHPAKWGDLVVTYDAAPRAVCLAALRALGVDAK